MNNIFVYCEIEDGKVADVSLELLTKGRVLADTLGCELEALAIGSKLDGIEKELAQYGADTIHIADAECLARTGPCPTPQSSAAFSKKNNRRSALFGASPVGRDLGPRGFVGTAQRPDGRLYEPRNRPASPITRAAKSMKTCSTRFVRLSAATSSQRSSTRTAVRRWLPYARA